MSPRDPETPLQPQQELVERYLRLRALEYRQRVASDLLRELLVEVERRRRAEAALVVELERKNAELEELQRLRDDLTHMIVHDLRTPLTNLIGNLQTLEIADYDPELMPEMIPPAIEAGERLLAMVNDLLDISMLESGQLELDKSRFPVAEVVQAALSSVDALAREKGLALEQQVSPPDLVVCADREKLRRVLTNLVGNAVKFTAEGTVQVEVSREGDAGPVHLTVRDTGPGIPEEDRQRVFEKFGQARAHREGHAHGTGLGLTFVKLVAEAHGGTVALESEVGRGSTFTVVLPAGGGPCG